MCFLWLTLLLSTQAIGITDRTKAIKQAKVIFEDYPFTFFCEKPIEMDHTVFARKCDVCPQLPTKVNWMGIIPNKRLAGDRLCYQQAICTNGQGRPFKGINCCREKDKGYVERESDLHNIVPEEPMLSSLNIKNTIGTVPKSKGQHLCDFNYDYKTKTIEPPKHSRGMLARTYLYYQDMYGLNLSSEEKDLYLQWHYQFPPSEWERERNTQIYALTGKLNTWID